MRRWSGYVELADEDREALLALPYTLKSFSREHYIVREGQQAHECALLLSGFAFRQKLLRDGARQIISIHIPTEFVDLQNSLLGVADHSVQSLGSCEIAAVPRQAVIELRDRSPAIRTAMWIETLIDASIFREWVLNVGRRDAYTRMAHVLCELLTRLRAVGLVEDHACDLPITQGEFGVSTVHVNRVLQQLRADGLIELTGDGLKVPDWDRLKEAGEFDPTYLHLVRDDAAA